MTFCMKRKFHLILFTFLLFLSNSALLAQEDQKPKVALVLSGGGAKGIAHIPLLQALDSLGIVPDLVIGTSMGSIVGGLYSVGYSGDSIAAIAHQANWSELLGGDITYMDVSMEERSEFKRHLVDFDLVKGKPKIKSGLLHDQKLREFITSLTYPVFDVNDFDQLSIPYRAMTTDIVNGKEVLFSKGPVSLAMRASMSIPGVFKPVPYENTLLVDGGVLNNFPVNVAQEMGFDIIIGSDVGGGMQPKEKLESIPSLLFQAGMLTSNLRNPANRAMCDILLDHVPNLTYSTGDFSESDAIYLQGKIAVDQNMASLVTLAEELSEYQQRRHQLPEVKDEFLLDTLYFTDVSKDNLELVQARTNISLHRKYSTRELIDAVDRAMGTNLFDQITYHATKDGNRLGLELTATEHAMSQIKGSLHFDTFRSAGIMVNYTGRNIIGQASRLLLTLDIAIQPGFLVQYQKIFGKRMNWWWRSDLLGRSLDQKFFLQGKVADDFESKFLHFDNQLNMNLNPLKNYVGIGLAYRNNRLVPDIDPDINNNLLNLRRYSFENLEVGAHYYHNTFNNAFYPEKGMMLRAFVSRSLMHEVDLKYADPISEEVKGSTNGFTRLGLDLEKRIPLNHKLSLILGSNLAFIFEDGVKEGDLSFSDYGYSAKYSLGGVNTAPQRLTYVFPGLHEDELVVNQMMRINLAAQFHPGSKWYITPHLHMGSVGFTDFSDYIEDAFSPSGSWSEGFLTSSLISAGTTISYRSFMGPLDFDVSWVNDLDKVRVFFGVGLTLNRSN